MSTEEENIVAELEDQFGAEIADIPARTADQLPRMKVAFRIGNAFLNRSQNTGRKQLTAACVILESDAGEEFVGKKYSKQWGVETMENWQWLKKDMLCLELEEPKNAKDLLALCKRLEGICFTGSLVPNIDDAFPPNCFINKGARRHELEGGEGPAGAGPSNI